MKWNWLSRIGARMHSALPFAAIVLIATGAGASYNAGNVFWFVALIIGFLGLVFALEAGERLGMWERRRKADEALRRLAQLSQEIGVKL